MSSPLLWRAGLRHLSRHPWQIGLAVLGVALGVAVVVAIDLANASATRAFDLSTEAVVGSASHQVVAGPAGIPEEVYRRLVLAEGIERAAPVVEGYVATAATGRLLHLLGIDPFSERPFRPYLAGWGEGRTGFDLAPFLTRPGACLTTPDTAAELGVAPGQTFQVRVGGGLRRLELVGLLEPASESARQALAELVVADVATAQEVLGSTGRLSRIDLGLPPGPPGPGAERLLARVRAALPPGAELVETAARSRSTEEMTRAFRLNLTALSLLALVCGVFLIYNTITFSVVQRRTLFGMLRALGVTRGQVFALVLAEAAAVALAGTAGGLGAGVLLGRGLVRLVTQTINDLYFVLSVRALAVPALTLAKGASVGIGATLFAALMPAWEATATPPRAVLTRSGVEARARRILPRATAAGVALLALGTALLAAPGGLALAFAGLFAGILGSALLVPAATVLLMRLLRPAMGALFGVLGRMAAGGVVAALSRTGVAVAALVVAVATAAGVGVMIGSFRTTVERWLAVSLQADLYVAAPGRGGGFREAPLDPALADRAAALPGVARVDRIRRVEVLSPAGPVRLVALDLAPGSRALELRPDDPEEVRQALTRRGEVIVSEPFARRRGAGPGSELTLRTARGPRRFRVAAVFADYTSDQGLVMMSRETYVRLWGDRALSGFALTLASGAAAPEVARRLRQALPGLSVQSNRALRQASLAVFDRTFRITGVLRLLAGLVAFIGVLSALMALQLERGRELAVLRANGLTPRQVWQLVTAQTGLLGLAAGLLSMPVGLALAAVMTAVINRRSFGWTVRLDPSPAVLLEAVALALAAALAAGLYPAWKMARTPPALGLREE